MSEKGTNMHTSNPPVAIKILSVVDDDQAIWSVNVGPEAGPGRLCGAWVNVNAADARSILDGQPVHVLNDAPVPDGVRCRIVDVEGTRQRLHDEIDILVAANRGSRTPKGNRRAPLQPPTVPPIPTERTPIFGVVATEPAAVAAIFDAHYLAQLADAWSKVETLRLGRDYLRGDIPHARPFPCVARESG